MKKAKILFPALGVLILSSAAAVTGTVAWFTANLQATAETDSITVVKTGSSLGAELFEGFGTTLVEGDSVKIQHSTLIDGSVDLTQETPNIYNAEFETDGSTLKSFKAKTDGTHGTQFRATKFTVKLTMDLEKEKGNTYGIYLDRPNCSVGTTGPTAGDTDSAKALRIGLKTANKYLVWAPYDESAVSLEYVDETVNATIPTGLTYATYTGDELVKDAETDVTVDSSTSSASHKLWLGSLVGPMESDFVQSLNVDVYTWYEGAKIGDLWDVTGEANYTLAFNAVKIA